MKSILLLEQCAFQIWSWSIFDLKNSFRLSNGPGQYGPGPLSPKSPKSGWYNASIIHKTNIHNRWKTYSAFTEHLPTWSKALTASTCPFLQQKYKARFVDNMEKVYFRSQILERPSIGEYWNIFGVPVLPENVIYTLFRTCWCYSEAYNTGTQKWSSIVQYWCTSIWDLEVYFFR